MYRIYRILLSFLQRDQDSTPLFNFILFYISHIPTLFQHRFGSFKNCTNNQILIFCNLHINRRHFLKHPCRCSNVKLTPGRKLISNICINYTAVPVKLNLKSVLFFFSFLASNLCQSPKKIIIKS